MILVVVVIAGLIARTRRGDAQAIGVFEAGDFHTLALSANDPNLVFFGHHNGITRSTDGGRT